MRKFNSSPSHQTLLSILSGKIARIYNSDELGTDLKHDIACRLIAKNIGANSVSVLLYEGTKDSLYCAGRYIDPDKTSAVSTTTERDIVRIMKRIDIIEFIKIQKIVVEVQELSKEYFDAQYENYLTFDLSSPIKLPRNEFVSFLKLYANPKEKRKIDRLYDQYSKHIRDDFHTISPTNPVTGAFYHALTHADKNESLQKALAKYKAIGVGADNIIVTDLNKFPKNQTCSENLLKKLSISIDTDAYYVGIPLYVNKRPIGILRLILQRKINLSIPNSDSENEVVIENFELPQEHDCLLYVQEIVNIKVVSLLISMFIENLFFVEGMRDISLKDQLNKDINDLPMIADELTKVINCHGCIIRLSSSPLRNASIRGFSLAVKGYVKALQKAGDPHITKKNTFKPVMLDLLYKMAPNKVVIECLKVDIDEELIPHFSYLSLDKNSRLVSSNNWEGILNNSQRRELNEIFSSSDTIFKRYDIKSIIQIPIKDQDYGFVTFANTSNRTFITKDVEMLIPVVNRLGLALKYDSSLARAENASKEQIQNSQRVIYHQLLSPIISLRNSFKNLKILNDKEEYITFDNRIAEVLDTLENSIDFITFNQYLSNFFTEKKVVPTYKKISLLSFIIKKIRPYQMHARFHRGIEIYVNGDERMTAFNTDENLLSHIIQAVIDNAIKYSYSHIENEYANPSNPLYAPPNTPKYIRINITNNDDLYIITVENWGCKMTDIDISSVKQYMHRGVNAKNFEENGTGIGLFLANVITEALNGTMEIIPDDDWTTIKLTFKQRP